MKGKRRGEEPEGLAEADEGGVMREGLGGGERLGILEEVGEEEGFIRL